MSPTLGGRPASVSRGNFPLTWNKRGTDIYQIAKNCRTSVEMIEKLYTAHIKNRLDAATINVFRPKPKPVARRKPTAL